MVWPSVAGIATTVVVAAIRVFAGPHWFVSGHLSSTKVAADRNIRDTELKLSAGVAAAFAAVAARGRLELSKSDHEIAKSQDGRARRQYATDLFSRAVEHLGNEAVDVRLGGLADGRDHLAPTEVSGAIMASVEKRPVDSP